MGRHSVWLCCALAAALVGFAPSASARSADSYSAGITGTVVEAGTATPMQNIEVWIKDTPYSTYGIHTDTNGHFAFDGLAAGTYTVHVVPGSGWQNQSVGPFTLADGEQHDVGTVQISPQQYGALSGTVRDSSGAPVPDVYVHLDNTDGVGHSADALTGADGAYTFAHIPTGTYAVLVDVYDTPTHTEPKMGQATVTANATTNDDLKLPNPAVPVGTTAHNSAHELALINAQRVAAGLPGGIALSRRWSLDCAAHDVYERKNGGLTHVEERSRPGYSIGGAWAGGRSVLAYLGSYTTRSNPWTNAPFHLLDLYQPSESAVGIDDTNHLQCVTIGAATTRTFGTDTVSTYPGNGVTGVSPAERAAEAPYVPGQFVGIPQGALAGRELFVYFNKAGKPDQQPVTFVSVSLTGPKGRVAVKTVDHSTRVVGPGLPGGIIIPVKPLQARATYTAKVTIKNGTSTISHTWSFKTGG